MSGAKELVSYFEEAATWDADRAAVAARTHRIAWVVALAGWLCAISGAVALALLSPLKSVTPYLIRVDSTTGVVDVVPQYTGTSQVAETVTRFLLQHYVDVCERFVWATAEADYEECGAFNSPHRNQQWAAAWATSNTSSPLNLYKDGTSVAVRVISETFFQRANGVNDLAQVRYVKIRRSLDGIEEAPTHWIATLQYIYGTPSKDPRIRQWNPLGFRILEFRPEPETSADVQTVPAIVPGSQR
ncbi:MAG: type IV secretion system protein [Proteobacteria bacterium]|nr:type IV secretion system protein [Pseudomonadota bacterium]